MTKPYYRGPGRKQQDLFPPIAELSIVPDTYQQLIQKSRVRVRICIILCIMYSDTPHFISYVENVVIIEIINTIKYFNWYFYDVP